jgi:hypothetical protein
MDIILDKRFCGPPDSANGGYTCGRLAEIVGSVAAIRLMAPPPLETALQVIEESEGIVLQHAGKPIGRAHVASLDLIAPAAPDPDAAREAMLRYAGFKHHWYPGCFVCGPDRLDGDGLRIFAGPLEDGSGVASPWLPSADLGDGTGRVRTEFVWSALDCPGAFTFKPAPGNAMLLGELTGCVEAAIDVGEPCVTLGWHLQHSGRKHLVGTAIYGADGGLRARARATWIEVPLAG